jgi:hypothetical protein
MIAIINGVGWVGGRVGNQAQQVSGQEMLVAIGFFLLAFLGYYWIDKKWIHDHKNKNTFLSEKKTTKPQLPPSGQFIPMPSASTPSSQSTYMRQLTQPERQPERQVDRNVEREESVVKPIIAPNNEIVSSANSDASHIWLHQMTPEKRQHLLIGAATGDGKTFTTIAVMIADIARGAQAVWLSPQATLYHRKDQPIDLRPLEKYIEVHRDVADITKTLVAIQGLIKQRESLYRDDKHVGHDVVIYMDELPRVTKMELNPDAKIARAALVDILYTGRKCGVWLVLAAQGFNVGTLGFDTDSRENFTALVGNVSSFNKRAMVGEHADAIPAKVETRKGIWYSEWNGKLTQVRVSAPSQDDVTKITNRNLTLHKRILDDNHTPPPFLSDSGDSSEEDESPEQTSLDKYFDADLVKLAVFLTDYANNNDGKRPSYRKMCMHLWGREGGRINDRAKDLYETFCSTISRSSVPVPDDDETDTLPIKVDDPSGTVEQKEVAEQAEGHKDEQEKAVEHA